MAAVSSEENLGRIDRYQADHRSARRPSQDYRRRGGRPGAARRRPFYWLSGSIHSPETGSPEMLMELAYRLAVEESPHVQAIRKNLDRFDHARGRSRRPRPDARYLSLPQGESRQAGARAGVLGQVRRTRQQPRCDGHGTGALEGDDEDISRVAPASLSRPARIGAVPLHVDWHRPL